MTNGDCNETLHELYSFLDGELTEHRRIVIQQHLDDCPPCFEAFDFEAELRMYVARKCTERVPDQLRARIAEAIGLDGPTDDSSGDDDRGRQPA